jgi:hypothetical protein
MGENLDGKKSKKVFQTTLAEYFTTKRANESKVIETEQVK